MSFRHDVTSHEERVSSFEDVVVIFARSFHAMLSASIGAPLVFPSRFTRDIMSKFYVLLGNRQPFDLMHLCVSG